MSKAPKGGFWDNHLQVLDYLLSHRAIVEVRDTGWSIWENVGRESVEVLPNLVFDECKTRLGFRSDNYVAANSDLFSRKINPNWHYFHHGIVENREIGNQLFFFQWISPHRTEPFFPKATRKWPLSSIVSIKEVELDVLDLELIDQFRQTDFYVFEGNLALFHLGSQNKGLKENSLLSIETSLRRIWKSDIPT